MGILETVYGHFGDRLRVKTTVYGHFGDRLRVKTTVYGRKRPFMGEKRPFMGEKRPFMRENDRLWAKTTVYGHLGNDRIFRKEMGVSASWLELCRKQKWQTVLQMP